MMRWICVPLGEKEVSKDMMKQGEVNDGRKVVTRSEWRPVNGKTSVNSEGRVD